MFLIIMGVLLGLLVITLIILIVFLTKDKNKKAVSYTHDQNTKSYDKTSIVAIKLPSGILKIPKIEIQTTIPKKIFQVYETLDYKKNLTEFNKEQWHTWQMSLLLRVYQLNLDFFIPKPKEVFPEDILSMSDKALKEYVDKIVSKYDIEVESFRSKDDLCNDVRWKGIEVGILFYFLSKYKTFPRNLR